MSWCSPARRALPGWTLPSFTERYGFTSFKLKGGVFPPEEEIAADARVDLVEEVRGDRVRAREDHLDG
ncbi:hypothetical protein ACFVLG_22240, partial [Streptomyces rochei]|uniref:hypothetical protein n=1 Tax=Streptomyces rochei TaxID=1928 RepID=UPI0036C06548